MFSTSENVLRLLNMDQELSAPRNVPRWGKACRMFSSRSPFKANWSCTHTEHEESGPLLFATVKSFSSLRNIIVYPTRQFCDPGGGGVHPTCGPCSAGEEISPVSQFLAIHTLPGLERTARVSSSTPDTCTDCTIRLFYLWYFWGGGGGSSKPGTAGPIRSTIP